MQRKTLISLISAGVLMVVAAAGVFTYQSVYAQATTPTPSAPSAGAPATGTTQPGQAMPGKGMRGGGMGVTNQELATALGITVEKLQAAEQSANTEALKQAVAKGLITQAQADQFAQNSANNNGHVPMFDHFGASGIDYNALLASALGISTDQLQTARTQALTTNLDAAVKAGTLTQAQADNIKARNALETNSKFQSAMTAAQAAMKAAYEAAVKQAVTDGVITQAQADQILQNTTNGFGPGFGGPGFGGHGFGGRHGGFEGANPGGTNAPVAPATGNGL